MDTIETSDPKEAPVLSADAEKTVEQNAAAEADEEFRIPSILESISQQQIDEFQPFHERYFEKKYCTKFSTESQNLDTCIRVHSNKICIVYLSEKHSIIKKQQRINSINFKINRKINRLQNTMSGKGKRGAQLLQPNSVLCYINTHDGVQYPVHAGIYGKLLEINSKVVEQPNFLIDDLCEGFLAVILPDLRKHQENMDSLKTKDEYWNT